MGENELIDRIKLKLEMMDENYDTVKPFIQSYLLKVEKIIAEKEQQRDNAEKLIKVASFSLSSLSDELGCSRTTFYNHGQFLKQYIEKSIELFQKGDTTIYCDSLRQEIRELKKQVNLMKIRDVELEILKIDIKNLNLKLNNMKSDNDKLTKRLIDLNNERIQLKN